MLRKILVSLPVALLALCAGGNLWALGMDDVGNAPLSDANFADWPGIMPLVNHPARVYHTWVNGNEFFYYRGNTAALNDALRKFAASTAAVHEVLLRPGPGLATAFGRTEGIPYDWQLHIVGGIGRHLTTLELGSKLWSKTPTMTVCVGKDMDLARIEIPKEVSVVEPADLGRRYREALASNDQTVRGWGAGELAELDPYDTDNLAAIAKLLDDKEDWVRSNAVGALTVFGRKAGSTLPALRRMLDTKDKNLKASVEKSIAEIQQAKEDATAEEAHVEVLKKIREFCDSRQAETAPAFGPVLERVLPSGMPCRELLFQFRSGEIFIVGNGPGTSAEEAAYDEKRIEEAGGVDMSASSGEQGVQIVGRGCFFTRDVEKLKWDRFTAAQAVEASKRAHFVVGVASPKKSEFPITYLFKTARGEVGIMEVLGTVEEKHADWAERVMKFRYKLVQGTGTPPPPAATAKSRPVFGPESNGLEAALVVTPGEPFGLRIHVRNVSDHDIPIEGASYRQEDECLLTDAHGRPVPIAKVPHEIGIGMHSGYYSPGQVAVFQSAGLSFQSIDKVPSSAGYAAQVKPGPYTLRVRLRLPGADAPFEADKGVWHGTLETGPVTIEVKDPATQPVVPVADETWSSILGPAVERTVNDLQTTHENCALSLDTGKLLPVPASITLDTLTNPPAQAAAIAWARDNQVDAIAFVSTDAGKVVKCGLLGPDLLVLRANNAEWDPNTATPEDLKDGFDGAMREWKFIPQIAEVTTGDDFPANYQIFDTRTHRRGVLQILGVGDRPRGVRIRYRLVEGAAVKKTAPESRPIPHASAAVVKPAPVA